MHNVAPGNEETDLYEIRFFQHNKKQLKTFFSAYFYEYVPCKKMFRIKVVDLNVVMRSRLTREYPKVSRLSR